MRSRSPLLARPGDITTFPSSYGTAGISSSVSRVSASVSSAFLRLIAGVPRDLGHGPERLPSYDQGGRSRPSRPACGGAQPREVLGLGGGRLDGQPGRPGGPFGIFRRRPQRARRREGVRQSLPRGGDVCRRSRAARCGSGCHPVPGGGQIRLRFRQLVVEPFRLGPAVLGRIGRFGNAGSGIGGFGFSGFGLCGFRAGHLGFGSGGRRRIAAGAGAERKRSGASESRGQLCFHECFPRQCRFIALPPSGGQRPFTGGGGVRCPALVSRSEAGFAEGGSRQDRPGRIALRGARSSAVSSSGIS